MSLRVVDENEAKLGRVVVVWADEFDFAQFDTVCAHLHKKGYRVLNNQDEVAVGATEKGLRDFLPALSSATAIAISPSWWTSMVAHQIVQLSSWLGLTFIDHEGKKVPTASLRSGSAS